MLKEADLVWDYFTDAKRWQRVEVKHIPTGVSTIVYRDEFSWPYTRAKAEREALIKLQAKVMAWIERGGR